MNALQAVADAARALAPLHHHAVRGRAGPPAQAATSVLARSASELICNDEIDKNRTVAATVPEDVGVSSLAARAAKNDDGRCAIRHRV
jgi:hypothetical protein